ncbi:MAG: hypothetical protein MI741_01350 [Rhodospirillales bacterium]|nr:hypothetical protein [Rhodospirillales bacterium]
MRILGSTALSFPRIRSPRPLAVLAIAGVLTGACTMFEGAPAPPCPQVLQIEEAASVTRFVDGPGRDLIDVLFEGSIGNASGVCEYDVDDDTETGTLGVEMTLSFEVGRGPANRDRQADLNYFVAITDAERRILNKQNFSGTVNFPGNKTRLVWLDEPVYLSIPLAAGQTGSDFRIFVGFDLSKDELQFNRDKIRNRRR